jgi:hypothetical protein
MSYRRLVPQTVYIEPNKTLVHDVCIQLFIVTSMPESDQATGELRGLHNVEPYDHSSSQSTIPRYKTKRNNMDEASSTGGGKERWFVDLREINHLERLRIDRRVILK